MSFATAPQLDYLIIPGGRGRINAMQDQMLLNFIWQQAKNSKLVLSICTGAFLLLKAGLLNNRQATTYWRALYEFRKLHDKIKEERIVKDGTIWTAGGISSGIDLALALIQEIAGEQEALAAQLLFEYFPNLNHNLSLNKVKLEQLKPYLNHYNTQAEIPNYIYQYFATNVK